MSSNLPVLQSNFLAKYAPLYTFLRHWATDVAEEIRAVYIVAVRTYYETGFRRYIRNLTQIKVCTWALPRLLLSTCATQSRSNEKATPLTTPDRSEEELDLEQITQNASVFGAGVTLAFMADTKSFVSELHNFMAFDDLN
jgi:vacuolar protein sorting-associated protein 52